MFQEGFFAGSPFFEIADKIKNSEEVKTMILTSIFVLGVISIFLFYIYQRMEVREKVYSINQMQEEQKKLTEENRSLQLEISSLRSLERIECIARDQLGLDVPKDVRNLK